ncbi:tRNA G18 (ribose-2'-O)-methylase SpoU [Jatrophihabitans sp. GAS493]|uniref:TrmH family RNA methyltransferase n=1 Tax=Jatrophihabitans sp. GAS493 TaxID=1907575 RepID=UPI000BB84A26|nr:RNA methyltransferase [Jatrophihabitans sp. GAS493]SOD70423.1 tRNA G18 (ribose-2'-O)-methylase SpoU [Jatrophihabitans sp. GAS493]
MEPIAVTDAADPRLDDFRDLKSVDGDAAARGVVIAEGVNVVERMLNSPYRVKAVFGVAARLEALAPILAEHDVEVYSGDKWMLSDVAGFRVTRGVLASAYRHAGWDAAALLASSRRLVLLEGLNDFENLGALFRNVAAFGADGVLLDAQCADPLYRRSVRVSMGHVLRVPFAVLPTSLPDALPSLHEAGFATFALTPRAGAAPLAATAVPARWALAFGAEGPGLTEAALAGVQELVRIPMATGVDSLNVATAVAVALAHFTA